jgi:hypothetical protein
MSAKIEASWVEENQRHLMASVEEVRLLLELHGDSAG